jgi:hypothetical protein
MNDDNLEITINYKRPYKNDNIVRKSKWKFLSCNGVYKHTFPFTILVEEVQCKLERLLLISGLEYEINDSLIVYMKTLKEFDRYLYITKIYDKNDITLIGYDYDRDKVERFYNE